MLLGGAELGLTLLGLRGSLVGWAGHALFGGSLRDEGRSRTVLVGPVAQLRAAPPSSRVDALVVLLRRLAFLEWLECLRNLG